MHAQTNKSVNALDAIVEDAILVVPFVCEFVFHEERESDCGFSFSRLFVIGSDAFRNSSWRIFVSKRHEHRRIYS